MNKTKHLEMIQAVINRMAANSFSLKAWCITLVAAMLALAAKDSDKRLVAVAYYPVAMFWILDGYFLFQERLFRRLYDEVRMRDETAIDFSMDTGPFKTELGLWSSVFSRTLNLFYSTMIVAIVLSIILVSNLIRA